MTIFKPFTIGADGFSFSFWIYTRNNNTGYVCGFTNDGTTKNSVLIFVNGNTLGLYIYYNYIIIGGGFTATKR
jgi:hypothetical protein